MAYLILCDGCAKGNHEEHVQVVHEPTTPTSFDAGLCPCPGECEITKEQLFDDTDD